MSSFFSAILSTMSTGLDASSSSPSRDSEKPERSPPVPLPPFWCRGACPTTSSIHWISRNSETDYVCSHSIVSGVAYLDVSVELSEQLRALHFGLVGVEDYAEMASCVSDGMLAACVVPITCPAPVFGIVYDLEINIMAVFQFDRPATSAKQRTFSWDNVVCIQRSKELPMICITSTLGGGSGR